MTKKDVFGMFEFDRERLADFDEDRISEALAAHPELYLNHLRMAEHITGWAKRLERENQDGAAGGLFDYTQFIEALREVAAHLRQADWVPGGGFAREMGYPEDRS